MNLLRLFIMLIKKHPLRTIAVLLTATAVIGASVGLFSVSAWLITFCAVSPVIAEIMVPVIYIRVFGILRGVLRYVERLISHDTTFRLLGELRSSLYSRIAGASMESILTLDKDDAFTRLVDDIERLQEFYLRTFNPLATAALTAALGYWLIARFGRQEAFLFIAIYGFVLLVLPGILHALTRGWSARQSGLMTRIKLKKLALLASLAEIAAAGALGRWQAEMEQLDQQMLATENRLAWSRSLATLGVSLATQLATLAVVSVAARRVLDHQLDLRLLPAMTYAVLALFEAVQAIPVIGQKIEQSRVAGDRIDSLAARVNDHTDAADVADVDDVADDADVADVDDDADVADMDDEIGYLAADSGSLPASSPNCLVVWQLYFRYPGMQTDLLADISFQLASGQRVAIIGASGSGKTTLAALLLGWLQPASGQIRYQAGRLTPTHENLFSVVNQDVYLFHTTIRNNLLLAAPDLTEQDLWQALKQVDLNDWVSQLPQGLDSALGEGDNLLSGGQRQRLAIARALLRPAPFLIMDEATAGIDSATEKRVLENIFAHTTDRGVLVISHRLVAMEAYDQILVLDNHGRVCEQGDHQQLLARQGPYNRIWQLQHDYLN